MKTRDLAAVVSDVAVFELAGRDSLDRLRATSIKAISRRITVTDPTFSPDTLAGLERSLNRWYFACGCEQGSVTVLLTLAASMAAGVVNNFDTPFEWWQIIGYLIAAGLVGKALGLTYAKLRLHGLYRYLDTHYLCLQEGEGSSGAAQTP